MPDVDSEKSKKERLSSNVQRQNTVTLTLIIGTNPMLSLVTGILIVAGLISIIMGVTRDNPSLIIEGVTALFLSAGLGFFLYKRAPEIDAAKKIKKITPFLHSKLLKIEENNSLTEKKLDELEVLYSNLNAIFENRENLLNSQLEKPSQDWESRAMHYLQKRKPSPIVPVYSDTIQNTNMPYQPAVQSSQSSPVVEAKLPRLESHNLPSSSNVFQNPTPQSVIQTPKASPVAEAGQLSQKSMLHKLNLDLNTAEGLLDEQQNTLNALNALIATGIASFERAEEELESMVDKVSPIFI